MSVKETKALRRSLSSTRLCVSPQKEDAFLAAVLLGSGVSLAMVFSSGCGNTDTASLPSQPKAGIAALSTVETQSNEHLNDPTNETAVSEAKVSHADEECCTDPGSIALCWWKDAERDKVVCLSDEECGGTEKCNLDIRIDGTTSPPNRWGLCECSAAGDCASGVCTEIDGNSVCGPSYCNGYLVCACFGGCTEANVSTYDNPKDMCRDTERGFPGSCCEGNYPSSPDGSGIGFCSNSCYGLSIGSDCKKDADCTDSISDPYSPDCARYVCDRGTCRIEPVNENTGCNEDDADSCTTETCRSGVCAHDPLPNVGNNCNSDNNACTLDDCGADGNCVIGPLMDCNDDNICTYPDTCEDKDPDHIAASCLNPAVNGNAETKIDEYTDTEDCIDLICVNGAATPTATDCSTYNPSNLDPQDAQCNAYVCVNGKGEDNCTLSYSLVGANCTDGNACTVGDRCMEENGYVVCSPGDPLNCDDRYSCTVDTCSSGTCIHTPDVGVSCEDGNPCTDNDICAGTGSCIPGSQKDCSAFDTPCANGVCNAISGSCEPDYLAEGTTCSNADNNPCTQNDACDGAGNCVEGAIKNCSAETDTCNVGVCNTTSGLCEKDPTLKEGAFCNADNNPCTVDDTCQSGVCTPGLMQNACAAYSNQCNTSVCNAANGVCIYQNTPLINKACDSDSNGCTHETCQGAADGESGLTCTAFDAVNCDDGNPCTSDTCVSTGSYTHTCNNSGLPVTTSCNADSDGCTAADHCNGTGACVAGDTVTAVECETAVLAAHPTFDLDCNTAECMSTGNNSYECAPSPLSPTPAAGLCNADNNGCTLDTCDGNDSEIGAVCSVGSERDCSLLDNLPCLSGSCADGSDGYSSSCGTSDGAAGVSCDADNNGCTENDECDGNGVCRAGSAVVCTPSDACIIAACKSSGADSYDCDETPDTDCCRVAADCTGLGYPCEDGGICNFLDCEDGVCTCLQAAEGTDCSTEIDVPVYPKNCYNGACNTSADCQATMMDLTEMENNLCSDLFNPSDPTSLDTGNLAFLGSLSQSTEEGTVLSAAGSTLCAENNYQASAANNCKENGSGDDLGASAKDVVYGFTYESEASTSRAEYAYVVKVEADFDVAVYAKNGISGAGACPEGNNPDADDSGVSTLSWQCSYPYTDAPMPDVIEETCDTGNNLYDQTCCDPCLEGDSCGYKWCERGYNTSNTDTCDLCADECEDSWVYPDDPYNCDANKPSDASYSGFTYMATTVIRPTAKNGSLENALVYVDGSNGAEGNFYITVEKRRWYPSPCERVNDDARVNDVTDAGSSGQTFYDTVENLANGNHADPSPSTDTACGGYDCDGVWDGNNNCHDTLSAANPFWPAEAYYNIHRTGADGSAAYCVTAFSPTSNALDAVLTLYQAPGAADICYEDFDYVDCKRNNYQITGEQMEFTALTDVQYLIGVSRYSGLNRPCLNSTGDNCDFSLTIREGACPISCVDLSDWYSGYVGPSAVSINGSTFATTYTDATIGTIYRHLITGNTSSAGRADDFDLGEGWDGKDEVHQLTYSGTGSAVIYFSGCLYDGSGSFNGQTALYDCKGNLSASNDDGCGMNGMPAFSYLIDSASAPYYLVVDGKSSTDNGAFNIAVYYAPTCTDGLKNGAETGVDCGGSCPACAPTCTDGLKNGAETGVDCGGSCPACTCASGRCKADADCASSAPWCDTGTSVVDAYGCGLCRNYFVQCNAGNVDPNTQLNIDAEHGKRVYVPMDKGCINMDMTNDPTDFENVRWHNRTIKIQPEAVYSGTCTYPYTLSWTTTYCVQVGTVDTLNMTYDMATILSSCSQIGTIRGTQTVDYLWDNIQIPVRRYALSMDLQFQGSDSCVLQMVTWYDGQWDDPPNPAKIACPPSSLYSPAYATGYFGPTAPVCFPNPPRKP